MASPAETGGCERLVTAADYDLCGHHGVVDSGDSVRGGGRHAFLQCDSRFCPIFNETKKDYVTQSIVCNYLHALFANESFMQTIDSQAFRENIEHLERSGFLLIGKVLNEETVTRWRETLYDLYDKGAYEIDNSVGNVAFEKLLALRPELSRGLIAHSSVRPYLKAILGKQCQLRSFRAHMNPREYLQEWHMDFYDYWCQEEKAETSHPAIGLCMNTTFYLTDNTPERGRLRFLKNFYTQAVPEEIRKHTRGSGDDRTNPFQVWCDEQEHEDLYPMAGDAVVFYSHIPHQGSKIGTDAPGLIRANVVLHYQQNPMFPGIRFVSDPQFTLDQLGFQGTFPFAGNK